MRERRNDMTNEAQRIEIAKACGWAQVPDAYYHDRVAWTKGEQRFGTCDLPDYLSDLNAMHDAEKVLLDGSHSVRGSSRPQDHAELRYIGKLSEIVGLRLREIVTKDNMATHVSASPFENMKLIQATASQRAEAFLRTLSLWDDSK